MDDHIIERRSVPSLIFNNQVVNPSESGKVVNNVRAPAENDSSFQVWNALNQLHEMGAEPSTVTAMRLAIELKRDINSTVVTFMQWQKFHELRT